MTGLDAYKIWAKAAGVWAAWVRPVAFISADTSDTNRACDGTALTPTTVISINKPVKDCAVILDLPSSEAIFHGVALARRGFRPIPLYNGCNAQDGTMSLVDNHNIESALLWAAAQLEGIEFIGGAPPVFLLDSNRTQRFKMNVSVFDNSWDVYPQDLPSAKFFLENGIKSIAVEGARLNKDLRKIFKKYKRTGIKSIFYKLYP